MKSIAALRAGKHVLCEKPVALNFPFGRPVNVAAQRSNVVHSYAVEDAATPCAGTAASRATSSLPGEEAIRTGWVTGRAMGAN